MQFILVAHFFVQCTFFMSDEKRVYMYTLVMYNIHYFLRPLSSLICRLNVSSLKSFCQFVPNRETMGVQFTVKSHINMIILLVEEERRDVMYKIVFIFFSCEKKASDFPSFFHSSHSSSKFLINKIAPFFLLLSPFFRHFKSLSVCTFNVAFSDSGCCCCILCINHRILFLYF